VTVYIYTSILILRLHMSSSSFIVTLTFITQQINIFGGLLLFISGIIGNLLTLIVFLSFHTFRHNSCSFHLSVMSFVNIGQLLTGLLSRITINMSDIDWTQLSLFYCKFRMYFLVVCTNISMICMCLSTIDQYLATCHRPRWQRWSNLKSACYLSTVSIIVSFLIAIPCLIYYIHTLSPITGQITCTAINDFFIKFNIYFYRLTISNIFPLLITLLFGLLTYRNVQNIAYRTIPLVRRELEKQLTTMVLVQDVFTFFVLLPIMTLGFISLNPNINQNPLSNAEFQLVNTIAVIFYYAYFVVSIKKNFLYFIVDLFIHSFRHHFIFMYVFLNDFVVN
jgi:hypothetical protein